MQSGLVIPKPDVSQPVGHKKMVQANDKNCLLKKKQNKKHSGTIKNKTHIYM